MRVFNSNIGVNLNDGSQLDSTGRLRISTLRTILESKFLYDKSPLLTDEKIISTVSGTSKATLNSDATIDMEVGDDINDRVVRQTKQYANYQPGKSFRVLITSVLNSIPTDGIVCKLGYFDDERDKSIGVLDGNGLFFQLSGTTLSVVLRKTQSLTQIDEVIPQNDWNLDKLDGSGNSGINIDITKAQLYVIDFIWLGVGRIRFGVIHGGKLIYCHEIKNADVLDTTYMNTPSLPIRYEIENVGGVTNNCIMKQICSSVMSEGGFNSLDVVRTVDRGVSVLSAGVTIIPAVALRLTNNTRGSLKPLTVSASNLSTNRDIRVALYVGAVVTGGSWNGITNSIAEVNITATSVNITNATLLTSFYITGDGSLDLELSNQINVWKDIEGNSDELVLCFQTTGSSSDVLGGITFKEIL